MREEKVHYLTRKGMDSSEPIACNLWFSTYFHSKDKDKVTCGNCKRTNAFKNA